VVLLEVVERSTRNLELMKPIGTYY